LGLGVATDFGERSNPIPANQMLSVFRRGDLEFPSVWKFAHGWMDGARLAFGAKKKELARHAQGFFPEGFRGWEGISPSTAGRSPW